MFVEVLANGGGASTALQRLAPFITAGDREGLPFLVSNARKDIDYYRSMSGAAGAQRTIADGVADALCAAVDAGQGQAWMPELVRIFRRSAD